MSRTIHRVAAAFAQLMPRYVHFHQQRETGAMKTAFHAIANFPYVIGCVDCTHVKIATPTVNEHEHVNRKNDHTINVQLICDSDALIMNCVVKWPGSVHDARIMRECPVFGLFETVPRPLDGFILGDSGEGVVVDSIHPCRECSPAEIQRRPLCYSMHNRTMQRHLEETVALPADRHKVCLMQRH